MKPGIQTTEFWLALVVAIAGVITTTYAESPWAKIAGIVAAAGTAMGYGAQRAAVKNGGAGE